MNDESVVTSTRTIMHNDTLTIIHTMNIKQGVIISIRLKSNVRVRLAVMSGSAFSMVMIGKFWISI